MSRVVLAVSNELAGSGRRFVRAGRDERGGLMFHVKHFLSGLHVPRETLAPGPSASVLEYHPAPLVFRW